MRALGRTVGLVLLAALHRALAEEPPPAAPPPAPADVEQRLRALEEQNRRLSDELARLREDHDSVEERLIQLMSKVSGRISGYLDFGFFHVGGDGTGIRPDVDRAVFPANQPAPFGGTYNDIPGSWVFLGDPLSTTVNSRGEPANTQGLNGDNSRAVVWNPIGTGATSFIVNALNVQLFAGLGPNLTLNGSFDLVPRSRNVSDPNGVFLGDFIDVKLAYAEYTVPIERFDLRISAGKFDSVLGIEYRTQESPDRFGVTPSLICRYTCGRPLGLKARARFADDLFVIALAVTNGSHMIEGFPFYDEIATHDMKTFAGRVSTKLPLPPIVFLEVGGSGAFGAQDFQAANDVYQWHYGVDLHLAVRDFDLRAEFVQGSADGKTGSAGVPCDPVSGGAPCLNYKGAYGIASYRILNWLGAYARGDWRDAVHRSGDSFLYVSRLWRATVGLRLELGTAVILKAEYTFNREIDPIPQIPNDVFTTSMVVKY